MDCASPLPRHRLTKMAVEQEIQTITYPDHQRKHGNLFFH